MADVDWAPSPREAEVLELVGQRLTNAQIARRLFISERTVESHVSALLRKSGLDDRRALSTYASEQANAFTLRWPAGPVTSFVGREVELAEVEAAIQEHRLTTLVGPGGVGKTRLALCALEGRRAAFADLSTLPAGASADAVARAVASAVGMVEPAGVSTLDAVTEQLSSLSAVVVLDNCEHLIDGAALMAERLLAAGSTVVATSRERLAVPGEHVVAVGPLPEEMAVALFLDRVAPAEVVGLAGCPRVTELCTHLEGIPLVIELAAARLGALSIDDLLSRLDQAIPLLGSGGGSRHRHRSLRATLDWSYDLLTSDEKALYRCVAVLRGPFRLAVAEELFPEDGRAAAAVAHLVEASLLVRQADRYRQLSLIRADALERLQSQGEEEQVRSRLVDWAVRELATGIREGDEADLDAAVEAARHLGRPELPGLAQGVAEAWEDIGHWADAEALYELAAVSSGDPHPAIAGAELAWSRCLGDRSVELFVLAEGLASANGDAASEAYAAAGAAEVMCRYGGTMRHEPEVETGREVVERAEGAALRAGDPVSALRAALARMWLAHLADDPELLAQLAGETRGQAEGSGDVVLLCSALDGQTDAAMESRRLEDARAVLGERMAITNGMRSHKARVVLERADTLMMACELSCVSGEFDEMLSHAQQLDKLARRRGIFYGGLTQLAPANFFLGNFDECVSQAMGVYGDASQRPELGVAMLVRALACAGAVFGYRADEDLSAVWFDRARRHTNARMCNKYIFLDLMEADVMLHHGRRRQAAALLERLPETVTGAWGAWYGAIRAEAMGGAALAEADNSSDAGPYVHAVLARARGDLELALSLFERCGANYQAARTALAMGGQPREEALLTYKRLGLADSLADP